MNRFRQGDIVRYNDGSANEYIVVSQDNFDSAMGTFVTFTVAHGRTWQARVRAKELQLVRRPVRVDDMVGLGSQAYKVTKICPYNRVWELATGGTISFDCKFVAHADGTPVELPYTACICTDLAGHPDFPAHIESMQKSLQCGSCIGACKGAEDLKAKIASVSHRAMLLGDQVGLQEQEIKRLESERNDWCIRYSRLADALGPTRVKQIEKK